MPVCSVFICKNRTGKQNNQTCKISYHRFPSDPNIKGKWMQAAGRSRDWFPTKSSRICSAHFKESDFQVTNKSRRLYPWAVPTKKIRLIYEELSTQPSQPSTSSAVNTQATGIDNSIQENTQESSTQPSPPSTSSVVNTQATNIDNSIQENTQEQGIPPSQPSKSVVNIQDTNSDIQVKTNTQDKTFSMNRTKISNINIGTPRHASQFTNNQLPGGGEQPGPSHEPADAAPARKRRQSVADSSDTSNPPESREPLSLEQCRFCGEFTKDCVSAIAGEKPYLANNKTTITFNDISVELDFNHDTLPKSVCKDCDARLQEFHDFVQQVNAAQHTLIDVTEEKREEIETLIVKTESVSPTPEDNDNKEGIVDSLAIGETEFVKEAVFTHKRKNDDKANTAETESVKEAVFSHKTKTDSKVNTAEKESVKEAVFSHKKKDSKVNTAEGGSVKEAVFSHKKKDSKLNTVEAESVKEAVFSHKRKDSKLNTAEAGSVTKTVLTYKRKNDNKVTAAKKQKKSQVTTEEQCESSELIIDIKEEVIESDDTSAQVAGNSGVSDTGTDGIPSELDLATSALLSEMAGDQTFS